MSKERSVRTVNISSIPELLRLVEEVKRDNQVIVLTAEDKQLAVLSPLASRRGRSRGKRLSETDVAAFRSSAGSWSDADTDKLVEDIYESRARSSRPPVGSVVARTAGAVHTSSEPARSAKELREAAEEAIAEDTIERSS